MTLARKAALSALMLWTMTVTCLRALRTPNDFAEAHWLLDYRFGFVKRGMIGELLSLTTGFFSIPVTAQLIAALASVAFAIVCCAMAWLAVRVAQRFQWSTPAVLVSLVFLSSPFVVMSAHLIGYFDGIVIVLGVCSILLLINRRPWLGAGLQCVAVLVHENALLIVFPLFCWTRFLANRTRPRSVSPSLPLLPLFLPLLAFAVLVASRSLLAKDFAQLYEQRLSAFPFIQAGMNTMVPAWVSQSFVEALNAEKSQFINRLTPMYSLGLAFSALVIVGFVVDSFRLADLSVESLTLLAICFVPQGLHVLAWDTARIWTYSTLCSFVALWVYSEFVTPRASTSTATLWCLFGLAINVVMGTPLMDGLSDRFTLTTRLLRMRRLRPAC